MRHVIEPRRELASSSKGAIMNRYVIVSSDSHAVLPTAQAA
jgi:hypothetical protein